MDIQTRVAQAEQRARACDLSITDLCREAEVHRATWQRWKAGVTEPKLSAWDAVETCIARHEGGAAVRSASDAAA